MNYMVNYNNRAKKNSQGEVYKFSYGFTLLELMVALAIVAIMVMWGTPSLQRLLASQRLNSVVSEYRTAFTVARFESYGQGRRIVMAKNCALSPSGSCSGVKWASGFQIFVCRGSASVSDQCAAVYARGETNLQCPVTANSVTADNCVSTPSNFYQAGAVKQAFEGYASQVRICDASVGGGTFRNSQAIVFNPNGSIAYHDGASIKNAANLSFYLYQERGGAGNDVISKVSLSGDGQMTANRSDNVIISTATSGCEPKY